MKTLTILLSIFLFTSCSSSNSEKAELVNNMATIKNIGKTIPSCNQFLKEKSDKMPSPELIKRNFKGNKRATLLLKNALFSFRGGEPIEAYTSQSIRLIIFKDAGLYLQGDGAVRDL
ncbi:MAG: hypothetical protein NE330_01985 [Lentisphaeraceae bacterium]|nr:hypothetical protein [Lentisphaeraceae bacterium]